MPPPMPPAPRRLYTVGPVQFDETTQELRVAGMRRPLEAKPLAVLHALLIRAGARVSKRALIEAVWGNADHISEASLTTAMSKLRAALGETARDLIDVIPGAGYRIAAPVEVSTAPVAGLAFAFTPGDTVPARPQWVLDLPLGSPGLNDVWRARHAKTGERRVFKFADSAARLETLQREAALSRVLHATLGARDDLIRVLEWNFETRPYWMESPYGGLSLPDWAAAQGGLAAIGLEQRLGMLARIARTLAAAHSAGVLHGDLKPANILVEDRGEAPVAIRLVDFGAGGLTGGRAQARADIAVTLHGLGETSAGRASGTLRYLAPEVLAGGVPTTAADIYALGILLFQLAAADLDRQLVLGWEEAIADDVLREDIAAAAAGAPDRRLASAASLAERLETLPERRRARIAQAEAQARAAALARQVEQARLRRPWILTAAVSLTAGLALSTLFGLRALHDRNVALRREAVVQAVNAFLTEDLLGRGNPANSGKADETLMDAAQAAEAGIDRRLPNDPMVAGAIYLALARAFDARTTFAAARTAYDRAIAAFAKAGQEGRADALIATLHEASMLAISGQPGSIDQSRAMLAAAVPRLALLGKRRAEAAVWFDAAAATLQMLGGDVRAAQAGYARAAQGAAALPAVFGRDTILTLRAREAFTAMRLGQWQDAARLFTPILAERLALNGPRHPDTLQTALSLAQIRIAQGQAAAAMPELDRMEPDFTAVFGPAHIRTLQMLATRAAALIQLERYADAVATDAVIHDRAVSTQGAKSYLALGSLGDMAEAECRGGDTAAGLAAAQQERDGALAAFGPGYALTQAAAGAVAFCAALAGRGQMALDALDGVKPDAIAELTMDPDYPAELSLIRAAAEEQVGQIAAAAALLRQIAPAFAARESDAFFRRWHQRLTAALPGGMSALGTKGP